MSLHAKRRCAICNGRSTHYDIVHLAWSESGRLRLCEECLDDLLNAAAGPNTCTYCGNYAQYGTWTVERWDKYGSVTPQEYQRVPKYRLLCEKHFQKKAEEVDSRERQSQLEEFENQAEDGNY